MGICKCPEFHSDFKLRKSWEKFFLSIEVIGIIVWYVFNCSLLQIWNQQQFWIFYPHWNILRDKLFDKVFGHIKIWVLNVKIRKQLFCNLIWIFESLSKTGCWWCIQKSLHPIAHVWGSTTERLMTERLTTERLMTEQLTTEWLTTERLIWTTNIQKIRQFNIIGKICLLNNKNFIIQVRLGKR